MTQIGLVTVLFTDLVDSTGLLSDLGTERADELRRAHFQSLRDAVGAHQGREVKNTGDGLMVAFDRPSDGAACAVDLQQRTNRTSRRHINHTLTIRVGLAVGEATSENGDWFGPPVVEAARLCAAADPGQILATSVVRALCAGRGAAEFVAHPPMTLKGLPEPVDVVEIAWTPTASARELPPLLAHQTTPIFVGRELEHEVLTTAWKRTVDGQRVAVLIAGEPGVGKTRLACALAESAQRNGATVLYGRCDEELGLAYQPFVEALDHHVATCDRDILDRHVAAFAGVLTRIVPELGRRVDAPAEPRGADTDTDTERYRLFEAVADLLDLSSEDGSVVLLLDDLHWADKGSLLLLRHLLRLGDPMPLLILGTYRDTELARTHPLAEMLADLRRHDDVERLSLSGLDAAGVEAFVEAAAGERLDEHGIALARAVHDETEGNPFFVGQVLRHLAESGVIFQRHGHWTFDGDVAQLGIPEGVREVIGRRLSRLPESVNRVLRTAAVVGREFDLRLVAEVDQVGEDEVVEALEAATNARLVNEVPNRVDHFSFAHALVRESLYDELSTSRRTRLHKRIGEALEARPHAPIAALAHHFCEGAVAGEPGKAAAYACQAGDEALAALAYEDGLRHFAQGIEVLDEAGVGATIERARLLAGLAAARNRAGELMPAQETAVQAATMARALGDAVVFGEAALASAVGTPPIPDAVAIALLQEALERLDPSDSALRSIIQSFVARSMATDFDRSHRLELARDALAMARRVGDPEAIVAGLAACHNVSWGPDNVEQRLAIADEMVLVENAVIRRTGYTYRFFDLYELGDIEGTAAALEAIKANAEETRERGQTMWAELWQTGLELFAGDLPAAEARLYRWFSDHRGISDDLALQFFGVQFFDLRRSQGRCEEVEPPVRALYEEHPEIVGWTTGLAMLLAELDDRDGTRGLFEALAVDDFASIEQQPVQFTLNVALATDACAYLGDRDRAQVLYSMLLPYAGRNIVVGAAVVSIGAASHYLGMLATTMEQWDAAEAHFEDALTLHRAMRARPWLARTLYHYALMRTRAGKPERVDALLDEAAALAEDVGMPALTARIAAARS